MSDEDTEAEEISEGVLIFLAEGRSQLYDSYASNALTLFGTEIAVLPIAFAVASVITSTEIETKLTEQTGPIFIWALLLGLACYIGAIGLTGSVYKKAKRNQFEYLDVVRDVHYQTFERGDDLDQLGPRTKEFKETAESRRDYANSLFEAIQQKIPGSEYEPPPVEKRLREEFGGPGSPEYEFYTKLRLSIWLTLSATILFISTVLATAGGEILGGSILLGSAAIMLALGFWSFVPILPEIIYDLKHTIGGLLLYGITFIWPGLRLLFDYITSLLKRTKNHIELILSRD